MQKQYKLLNCHFKFRLEIYLLSGEKKIADTPLNSHLHKVDLCSCVRKGNLIVKFQS